MWRGCSAAGPTYCFNLTQHWLAKHPRAIQLLTRKCERLVFTKTQTGFPSIGPLTLSTRRGPRQVVRPHHASFSRVSRFRTSKSDSSIYWRVSPARYRYAAASGSAVTLRHTPYPLDCAFTLQSYFLLLIASDGVGGPSRGLSVKMEPIWAILFAAPSSEMAAMKSPPEPKQSHLHANVLHRQHVDGSPS